MVYFFFFSDLERLGTLEPSIGPARDHDVEHRHAEHGPEYGPEFWTGMQPKMDRNAAVLSENLGWSKFSVEWQVVTLLVLPQLCFPALHDFGGAFESTL